MDRISLGQSVKIKRTDGRIHAAVVSKTNHSAKSVTVEWYERGETKGKEVELDAILALNPEILQDLAEQHAAPEPKKQATAPMNLSRNPTHSAIGGANRNTNRMTVHVGTAGTGGGGGGGGGGGIGASNSVSSVLNEIMESNTSVGGNSQASATTGIIRPRNTHLTNAGGAGTRIASAVNTNTGTISGGGGNTNATTTSERATAGGGNNTANNTGNTTTGSNVGGRRSYVVKEVERLKENREKRRARQAEIKEEKVALMNQDPGNPNWETAQMIREYQNTLEFNPLIDGQIGEDHQITVCVRKRPLSRKEIARKEIDVISVQRKDVLTVHEPRNKVDLTKFLEHHRFRFDYAFNEQCDNAMVYKYTAKPLVKTIFDGGMATCFAYGQTGSGKTHTMGGEFNGKVQDCKNGIYAMAAKDVFILLNNPRYRSLNLVVSASFFEIYSGKVFDLLADKQKLRVLEDGKQQVQVVGLTEKVVDSVEEVLKLIQHGNNARTSGQTSANSNSSRSHAVFQIVLRPPGSAKIHGKFSFIDLAGNERGADTSSANRQTRMEGAEINKSLLALKECIRALGKQSSHLPFRVSKLTQVLRDSFIGEKSKTCMIAMISPGLSSCEHTLNTLRYADRVKELVVKDTPEVVHEEEEMREEIMEEEHEEDEYDENIGVHQLQQTAQLTPQGQHRGSDVGLVGLGLGIQHNNHNSHHHHHNNNNNNNKNGPPTEMDLALLRSLSPQTQKKSNEKSKTETDDEKLMQVAADLTKRLLSGAGLKSNVVSDAYEGNLANDDLNDKLGNEFPKLNSNNDDLKDKIASGGIKRNFTKGGSVNRELSKMVTTDRNKSALSPKESTKSPEKQKTAHPSDDKKTPCLRNHEKSYDVVVGRRNHYICTRIMPIANDDLKNKLGNEFPKLNSNNDDLKDKIASEGIKRNLSKDGPINRELLKIMIVPTDRNKSALNPRESTKSPEKQKTAPSPSDDKKTPCLRNDETSDDVVEHDMSDEMLVQHAAINDLQQTEEMVVDQHRSINEFLEHFLTESKALYDLTNYVDYDQDAYCKKGQAMFTQLVDIAIVCRDMMSDYRAKLAKEEMLSCNFKPPNKR